MTKRDTIIIATLVNAGLLACLFVAATRQEETTTPAALTADAFEPAVAPVAATTASASQGSAQGSVQGSAHETVAQDMLSDEIDQALKEFLPDEPKISEIAEADLEMGLEADLNPELAKEAPRAPEQMSVKTVESVAAKPEVKMVDITVKAGDMLEKIARANNTTVKAIKEANHLQSDKLKVGQVLKIPVGSKAAKTIAKAAPTPAATPNAGESVYYTIQKGDNPWKIAKKFHVKFEDILRLNNMSEEKAKNLKVGQEIRVK